MIKSSASERRPWVVGNWKMNGSIASNEALLSELLNRIEAEPPKSEVQCGVAVPFPYLFQAAVRLKGQLVAWGAQDVSDENSGAYTGEVSASMLSEFECSFALVGHSERRQRHGEMDAVVGRKSVQLLNAGLTPIICVGESLAVRDAGKAEVVVCEQVEAVARVLADVKQLDRVAFAYEPIWAIGTGRSATPAQAEAMHSAIRQALSAIDGEAAQQVRLLYGGSVKASTAMELFEQQNIDGALVGGAALNATEFHQILCAVKD